MKEIEFKSMYEMLSYLVNGGIVAKSHWKHAHIIADKGNTKMINGEEKHFNYYTWLYDFDDKWIDPRSNKNHILYDKDFKA